MVDSFKNILQKLVSAHSDVGLFAILKMDELTDKWSVLISADWITEQNRKDIFAEIIGYIKSEMTSEESATIARVIIVSESNHLASELLEQKMKYIGDSGSVRVNGNVVHEAHILAPQWDTK